MSAFTDVRPVQPELQRFIESYRVIHGIKALHAKEIVPRPAATLMFDADGMVFNDTLTCKDPLQGLHTVPVSCRTTAEMRRCLVIKFSPYGLSRFTDTDISLLTNQVISAKQVFGDGINGLLSLLYVPVDPLKLIQQAEVWLFARYRQPDRITLMISDFADILREGANAASVDTLKKSIPLSERQLQRRFKALIGISMKAFIRLCKFERAQLLLLEKQQLGLTGVSFRSGYYDQAHFSHDFKAGSAASPGTYVPCALKK